MTPAQRLRRRAQIKDFVVAVHALAREMATEDPRAANELRRCAHELDAVAEMVRR